MPPRTHIARLGRLVAIHGATGEVLAVSDDLAALVGRRPDELVGQPGPEAWQVVATPAARARISRELAQTGAVRDIAILPTAGGEQITFAYSTQRVGELYVTVGDVVPGSTVARKRALERSARGGSQPPVGVDPVNGDDPWLTKPQACTYAQRSARTLERAVAKGELEAGGTPGRRSFRRSALDRWLARGLFVLMLVAVALLAVELVDVVVSWGGDWGVPPGTGHPLEVADDVLG